MTELVENLVQLAVIGASLALSLLRLVALLGEERDRAVASVPDVTGDSTGMDRARQVHDHLRQWFMLVCFYSCYFLALTYWALHLAAFGRTPYYFYVSDLGWIASFVFLLMLVATCDVRRAPQPPVRAAWLVPVATVPQLALYLTHGDPLNNVVQCSLMTAIGFFAVRGLGCRPAPGLMGSHPFPGAVLLFVTCEFATWTSSCFWVGEVFVPYLVADICLTVSMAALLACAWRVRP